MCKPSGCFPLPRRALLGAARSARAEGNVNTSRA